MRVLITGATGNVGKATINALLKLDEDIIIVAGLRNINKEASDFELRQTIEFQSFDFMQVDKFDQYLKGIDILFLLRPPQIADTKQYFQPLIDAAVKNDLQHIVFLSVQGADKNSIIPHHKIENMITDCGINFTFLRPAYFMQNFTTILRKDILGKSEVYLPAGKTKFTIVDVKDIGVVVAKILTRPQQHQNKTYELTNKESLSFEEMVEQINQVTGRNLKYRSPNLLSFFVRKRKEGVPSMFIFVMIMLHYFPRFQTTPNTTDCVKKISGKEPISFKRFVEREKDLF